MTVTEIKLSMSVNEFNGWKRYLEHEPTNSVEVQLALIAQMMASFMGTKKPKLEDYLITQFKERKPQQEPITGKQILAIFS